MRTRLDHGGPVARLLRGGDDPGRLVDRPDLARLGGDGAAVDAHVVFVADIARRVGDDLAADRDAAVGDDPLGHAARGDATVG